MTVAPSRGRMPSMSMAYLPHLDRNGPASMRELAAALGLAINGLEQSLHRDKLRGYIVKARPPVMGGRNGNIAGTWKINPAKREQALAWVAQWETYRAHLESLPPRTKRDLPLVSDPLPVVRQAPSGFVERSLARRTELERVWLGR